MRLGSSGPWEDPPPGTPMEDPTAQHPNPLPLSFPTTQPGWMREKKRSFQQLTLEGGQSSESTGGDRMAPALPTSSCGMSPSGHLVPLWGADDGSK